MFIQVCFSIPHALNFDLIHSVKVFILSLPYVVYKVHRYKQGLVPASRGKSISDHLLIHAFTLYMLAFYGSWWWYLLYLMQGVESRALVQVFYHWATSPDLYLDFIFYGEHLHKLPCWYHLKETRWPPPKLAKLESLKVSDSSCFAIASLLWI